jgi:ABC-type polar amino acid transport system, ATPase component
MKSFAQPPFCCLSGREAPTSETLYVSQKPVAMHDIRILRKYISFTFQVTYLFVGQIFVFFLFCRKTEVNVIGVAACAMTFIPSFVKNIQFIQNLNEQPPPHHTHTHKNIDQRKSFYINTFFLWRRVD